MDTMRAFAVGEANRGKELMVFDWHKAAELIKDRKPATAAAGLAGDWDWTGGDIFRDGEPIPEDSTYVYLASTWAIPEITLDGETLDCFCMKSEHPDWDARTYCPQSALDILNASKVVKP